MKRSFLFIFALCAAVFAISSCDTFQDDPEIVITTSNGQITAEPGAGELTFNYDVTNPKSGAVVSLEIPSTYDWITNPVIDETAKSITVTLAENPVKEARNAILTVKYTFGDKNVTAAVSIIQKESSYDYMVTCTYGAVSYFGDMATEDPSLSTSIFQISNEPLDDWYDNSYYYVIDVCGAVTEDLMPVPGTYTYSQTEGNGVFGFTGMGYAEWVGDLDKANAGDPNEYKEFLFEGGTVVIEREGNVYTITATLEDVDGKTHLVSFEGELLFADQTAYSTLEDDLDLTLTDHLVNLVYYGDGYGMGNNNYTYSIENDEYIILVDVCVPSDVYLDKGFSTIAFEPFDVLGESAPSADNLFITGFINSNSLYGCWYYAPSSSGMAPFMDGEITLTDNGDQTYNISGVVVDDRGYEITLSGNNLAFGQFIDYSQASAQMDVRSNGRPELTNIAKIERISRR